MSSRVPGGAFCGFASGAAGVPRAVRGLGRALAVAVPLLLTVGTAAFAEPSAADIQWAQTILKEKGFDIGGRANGQLTPQTRAALSSYQKSVGLPASGSLDQATISRMLADREKKATPTMGSLSKSQIGQSAKEKEVAPRAAPTQRVESGNESFGAMPQFGSAPPPVSHSSPAAPPAATSHSTSAAPASPSVVPVQPAARPPAPSQSAATAEAPAPLAAPRAAVTATDPAGKPVEIVQKGQESSGLPGWFANLLRFGVMGLLAATVGGIGFAWWRSGRSAGALPEPEEAPEPGSRREPSFGGKRREELTVPAGFGDMRARR